MRKTLRRFMWKVDFECCRLGCLHALEEGKDRMFKEGKEVKKEEDWEY